MVVKKKGQTIFVSFMIGVVFFWLGLTLAHPLGQVVSDARGDNQLNCSAAVAYQDKANCTMVDIMLPLGVGVIFGLAGFILTNKIL